jgi:hypothetical protein
VEKFRADPTFAALIETKKATLQAELFESGTARSILERWTGVLEAGGATTIQEESAALAGSLPA